MDGIDDGLAWWAGAGNDWMAALGRILASPHATCAVRTLATRMLELFDGDPGFARVSKDAGRYVAAMLAFMLAETDGLTLSRLKRACAQSGLLSEGRARSALQFLEHVGYVERRLQARGAVGYELTPAFRAAWTRHLDGALEAGERMVPDVAAVRARPELVNAFGVTHAAGLLAVTTSAEMPAFLEVFQHPDAGSPIVWTLIVSGEGPDFAPDRVGPVSLSGLSRRFGVSRIHVKRIFQEAERRALGRLDSDGVVHLEPAARDQMRVLFALQIAHILAAAAQVAAKAGLTSADGQICAVGGARARA